MITMMILLVAAMILLGLLENDHSFCNDFRSSMLDDSSQYEKN